MKSLVSSLRENLTEFKKRLPAEDILTYPFRSFDGSVSFAVLYADGLVNKEFLGALTARPLLSVSAKESQLSFTAVKERLLFPELKENTDFSALTEEILDGNAVLLIDGINTAVVVGAKQPPARSVVEPPTGVSVKGPREGFVEDIKINLALVRKRLKSPNLQFKTTKIGKQSKTHVALCFLDGTVNQRVLQEIEERLNGIDLDVLPDSSYLSDMIAPRKHSIFQQLGQTEKPDVFAAKISEGRVGILVDGSPIALTAPFFLTENFQAADDYYTSPVFATIIRFLRFIAVFVAVLLPAFYVSSQLFKLQLLPLRLTLTIASSIQGLPLSPSLEMFLVLFALEVIKEASIRMPKYVGMAMSIVGALVLGETAVSAGFVSTPAIIIVAFSGICLYTVPDFTETGSILRWIFLIVSGSFGPFGLVTAIAFFLYYAVSSDAFGAPLLAPLTPLTVGDLKDTVVKYNIRSLDKRPEIVGSKNKTRLKEKEIDHA
ncbi:MAG: spore germination protein [Clostridia bacterium]|nr:spore germination protein [Clostridia bacterium]